MLAQVFKDQRTHTCNYVLKGMVFGMSLIIAVPLYGTGHIEQVSNQCTDGDQAAPSQKEIKLMLARMMEIRPANLMIAVASISFVEVIIKTAELLCGCLPWPSVTRLITTVIRVGQRGFRLGVLKTNNIRTWNLRNGNLLNFTKSKLQQHLQ